MAINPELITTIRVDQLPDETLSLTNLFPHTVGTDLKSATIQELVDLVATAIGVSGGVGYIAISVTDGQQLPDVPELPSFFLCGAGTFLNVNGYPDVICTDELNAVMSLTDHWVLAVGIPIAAEVGVQSVTGSAVDNTDPLNPIINATGTPTLQEVINEGNTISSELSIITLGGAEESVNVRNATVPEIFSSVINEGFSSGILNKLTQYTCEYIGYFDSITHKNIKIYYPTSIVGTNKVQTFQDANGTIALTSDITTPTLQEVTDEGNETTNDVIVKDTENKISLQPRNIRFDDIDEGGDTSLRFINTAATSQEIEIRGLSGTMALLSDIPTLVAGTNISIDDTDPLNPIISSSGGEGGGIPHATASGTDTYTATITGVAAYTDADAYLIRFTNGNTTGATLNINSLGAKTLYRNNDGALIGGDIINGGEMLCIYNTSLNGFQLIGTAPNSLFSYVTNADSVTLTKGMPVYAFSGTGDRMTVKRANNSADATSAQTVGLVLSTSIAAGQKGLIMMQGLLDGLSILPTATFADGDPVYLGATAGTITNVKPYAPNHLVYLGVVTTASNGSAGRMYVRVQNGYELSEIHDVDLISNAPTNNQVLTYESSSDLWKNKTIIEDSITNGVTDKAPSQNAVFDALDNKVDKVTGSRLITSAEATILGNTSGTNTGDNATNSQYSGLAGRINQNYIISVAFSGTSPIDNTTYYIGPSSGILATTEANRRWQFPYATTIRTLSIALGQTAAGTSEAVSVYLRNSTAGTETLVGTFTSNFTAGTGAFFNFSGLNISIPNTTDNWTLKIVTPTWATNPTAWSGSFFLIAN